MPYRTAAICGALALLFGGIALAHNAASGWQYPAWCCSDRDCVSVPSSDVFEGPDFFGVMSTGETIQRANAMRSGDGGFHICRAPSGKVRCFFAPVRGS